MERGEFKLSIGGLNNNIPYTVQKLSKILQPAWSWQTRDFNMALKAEESNRTNDDFSVNLYELSTKAKGKRQERVNSNNIKAFVS